MGPAQRLGEFLIERVVLPAGQEGKRGIDSYKSQLAAASAGGVAAAGNQFGRVFSLQSNS